jgi:hypothetical protein
MERRSTSSLEWLVALVLLVSPAARADADQEEAFRDIGAVLGWRLSPGTIEEHCRAVDPDGADARKKALDVWLRKNDALIRQVDDRVAGVVPILFKDQSTPNPERRIREQVRRMLIENLSESVCKAERDPASTSWTSNGVPHVPESLAALYDWQIRHTKR